MKEPMDFGEALENVKDGFCAQREGWNGKDMWIALEEPGEGSDMDLPYIYMKTVTGDCVPWLASQTDLLAEDWSII